MLTFPPGHIDKFNIESGLHRMSYGKSSTRHKSGIGGIITDTFNATLVSGDQDGVLRWWCQHKGVTKCKDLNFDTGIIGLTIFRNSGLFAISLDDFDIVIADIDSKKIVRKFSGHSNKITDTAFTPDGKWLVSSSMDGSIRTWDIPTGHCIDHFRVPSPCSSLSLSPTRHSLATTHLDSLGVHFWANLNFCSEATLSPLSEDYNAPLLPLPGCVNDDGVEYDDSSDSDEDRCVYVISSYMHM